MSRILGQIRVAAGLADVIPVEAYTTEIPYVPTGQLVVPTAYRKNLDGIIFARGGVFMEIRQKVRAFILHKTAGSGAADKLCNLAAASTIAVP
jgi:hypothetical protein